MNIPLQGAAEGAADVEGAGGVQVGQRQGEVEEHEEGKGDCLNGKPTGRV